jgi:putative membrane protein
MHQYGFGYETSWFHMLAMIFFWLVVIGTAVYLVKQITNNTNRADSNIKDKDKSGSPEQIIKQRYARGEISKAEYEEMKEELKEERNNKD